MLSLWSQPLCLPGQGLTRRELLRVGAFGFPGFAAVAGGFARVSASQNQERDVTLGRARSCIFIFNFGGPSQLETFDLKPSAPDGIRGEFAPIATSVPGTRICEHLPRLAQMAHTYSIIRSMAHQDIEHQSGGYTGLTGHRHPNPRVFASPAPTDTPPYGSVVSRLRPVTRAVPSFVSMPTVLFDAVTIPGQTAGWLGRRHDPMLIRQDPSSTNYSVRDFALRGEVEPERFGVRQGLLAGLHRETSLDRTAAPVHAFDTHYDRALQLVASQATQSAFDVRREPARLRDRYGRTTFGQCCLLARRLVEAGVAVVSIYFCSGGLTGLQTTRPWDTHEGNFSRLKNELLPITDQALTALLEDLSQRELLSETLVAWIGEFGRTPRIGARSSPNGAQPDGRDHWPYCYSAVLAGGGIQGGRVHGVSDRVAGHPAESPVSPADFAATIYHCMGINPHGEIPDQLHRPVRFCEGSPIRPLL